MTCVQTTTTTTQIQSLPDFFFDGPGSQGKSGDWQYRAYPDFLLDWLEFGNLEIGKKPSAKALRRSQKKAVAGRTFQQCNTEQYSTESVDTMCSGVFLANTIDYFPNAGLNWILVLYRRSAIYRISLITAILHKSLHLHQLAEPHGQAAIAPLSEIINQQESIQSRCKCYS